MCAPLWRVTHFSDLFHLTSKSNFRICLLLGCPGLESDASRFSTRNNGQLRGDSSCKLVVQHLKMLAILFRHAPCWKLNIGNCLAMPPWHGPTWPRTWARQLCQFYAGNRLDWGHRNPSILHQLSSRTQGLQSWACSIITTSHYLAVLSWNGRQQRKKKGLDSYACTFSAE